MKSKVIIQILVLAFAITINIPAKQVFAVNYSIDGNPMASNAASLYKQEWKTANLLNDISLTTTLDKAVVVNYKLVFNGVEKTLSLPMLVADGRTYLPLRALGEEVLDADVDYDNTNGIAIVTQNGSVIETFAGSNKIVVDGVVKSIDPNNADAKAFIRDDRTYIPVRAIAEAFNYEVDWDGASKTVFITVKDTVTGPITTPTTPTQPSGSFDEATQKSIDDTNATIQQIRENIEKGIGVHGELRPTQPGTKNNQKSPGGDWEWSSDTQRWDSVYGS